MKSTKSYPCDITMSCPFNVSSGYGCRDYCGAGADEDIYDELLDIDSSIDDAIPDPLSYDNDRDFEYYNIWD